MQPGTIVPFFANAKGLSLQFVLAYTLDEFETAFTAIADGSVDASPMITATVDLDMIPRAFNELTQPGLHCKIMVGFTASPSLDATGQGEVGHTSR